VRRRYNEVGAPDNRINVVVSQVLTPRTKTSIPVLDFVVTAHRKHTIIIVRLIKSFFGKGAVAVLALLFFVSKPFKQNGGGKMNRELLEKPFDPDQIKQREGNFCKTVDYISKAIGIICGQRAFRYFSESDIGIIRNINSFIMF